MEHLFGWLVALGLAFALHRLAARALRLGRVPFLDPRPMDGSALPASKRVALAAAPTVACYAVAVAMFVATGAGPVASIVDVAPGGAAEGAGLRLGDHIVAADGAPVTRFDQLPAHVQSAAREQRPVALDVDRAGSVVHIAVTPDANGRVGVIATGARLKLPLSSAVAVAIESPLLLMREIVRARIDALTTARTVTTLGGPIAVVAGAATRMPATELVGETFSSACLGLAPFALLTHGLALARGRRKVAT